MGKNIEADPVKSARSAGLRYTKDSAPGIGRIYRKGGFLFTGPDGKQIKDKKTLQRIKSLVIPPAWRDVWISLHENSHLQATGLDAKGRKQYLYHPDWNAGRNQTKFSRLSAFAEWLPEIRKKVKHDLSGNTIDRQKVIAAVILLMEKSCMRIGNREYAIKNQSFGLTTLRDRHVEIDGAKLTFEFNGKKGVAHKVELHDRRLARIVQHCKEIPGYELFQYYDDQNEKHAIESGDVNTYLQEITGEAFSAKDFRTWAGTLHAFRAFREIIPADTDTEKRKQIVEVIKEVSRKLGNTPAVCRKYYIHPLLLESFENGKLEKFISAYRKKKKNEDEEIYDERMLLKFLENNKK
jgi:DNA topoisomerase I